MFLRQIVLLFFCASLCSVSAVAQGDGGAVVFSGESGPLRVTAFLDPVPPRVGPVDLSLLVQDRISLEVIETYTAKVALKNKADRTVEVIETSMDRSAATNRLFQAAAIEFPLAGTWQATLHVDTAEGDPAKHTFTFPIEVQPPPARFWDVAIWILLPAIPLLLFVAGRLRRIVVDISD